MAAGARTRNRLHKPLEAATPRRSKRTGKSFQDDSGLPEVFQDLLEDEVSKTASADEGTRPLKRRRTARKPDEGHLSRNLTDPVLAQGKDEEVAVKSVSQPPNKTPVRSSLQPSAHSSVPDAHIRNDAENNDRVRQTIVDSDESDDSDMEWEDALAEGDDTEEENEAEPEIGDVAITYGEDDNGGDTTTKKKVRRRAITSVDKKRRLNVHKMHILCLLYHVHRRNAWCNDRRVQAIMRKIPSPKLLSNMVPNPEFSQYQASKHFSDGLGELKLMWSKRFTVTARGMYKPRWAEADAHIPPLSAFDDLDDPLDLDDFRSLAVKLEGSQDVGTQLFCALLRAIGIEARLVCSLQVLPFASSAQPATPQKHSPTKKVIVLDPYNTQTQVPSPHRPRARGAASRMKRPSRLEQALGESHPKLSGSTSKPAKKYHTPYPVYWVEVFNPSYQKWVPIDVLSTFTINAPEKLEPPLSFPQNSLTYAIAFDKDYTAKDVTQRYTKAFNAKTRQFRVESTPHGEKWWRQTMTFFERSRPLDRDQVEDASLARKTAGEGIPKNVQDFKNHPIYVLERHLRHNEVIYPKNQVGKVNVGTSFNPKMELIYRRGNVHIVRSADKWYRMGRDVRDGEQPLKHAKPKAIKRMSIGPDDDEAYEQEEVGVGLYAEFQTELYTPPPVVRGRVPRNAYGNLDLYVPSMCPPGGIHIRHKLASKSARILGVDYADAVTGFNFKGRHGTAVVQGVVVAQEFAEAVEAVIDGMIYASEEAENAQRRAESLRLWRRFYLGLRIAQRVNDIEIDGEKGPVINMQEEIEKTDRQIKEKEFAGGFFPDEGETMEPTAGGYEPPAIVEGGEYASGLVLDEIEDGDSDGAGGFLPDETPGPPTLQHADSLGSAILSQVKLRPQRTNSFGGGFLPEDDDSEDGGFVRDNSPVAGPSAHRHHSRSEDTHPSKNKKTATAPTNSGGGLIYESESLKDETPIDEYTTAGHREETTATQNKNTESSIFLSMPNGTIGKETIEQKSVMVQLPITSDSNKLPSQAARAHASPPQVSSSPSEVDSLPMEDPDDEDADPEWLVDAT